MYWWITDISMCILSMECMRERERERERGRKRGEREREVGRTGTKEETTMRKEEDEEGAQEEGQGKECTNGEQPQASSLVVTSPTSPIVLSLPRLHSVRSAL